MRLRRFADSGFRGLTALFAGLTATVFFAKQQQWQVLGDWLNPELKALVPTWQQPSVAEPWFKLELALLSALLIYRLLKSWLAAFSAFSPELVAVANRLSKSTREAMQVADWSKDAGLRFRFARDFETVAKALGKGRLLLLIDDLDRCEPKQIESVMTTLNFLFSTPAPCYAVLAMHLLMLDVYMKGELATIVWQFLKNKKDNDRYNRLLEALMERSNAFPELKILMNYLERSYNEANDERSAEQEKAEAQLRLWFSLYAGLNTLRL